MKKVGSAKIAFAWNLRGGAQTQGQATTRKEISCAQIDNDRQKISRTGNPALCAAMQLVPRNDGENPEWRKIETAWRETEFHQTGSTLTPLHYEDFISAEKNPLSKASDGKPVGLEPGAVPR